MNTTARTPVHVLHNTTTDPQGRFLGTLNGYCPGDTLDEVFTYATGHTDPTAAAEEAFHLFNVGDDPAYGTPSPVAAEYRARGLRSLSVGDVVIVGDTVLACASFGWDPAPDVVPPTPVLMPDVLAEQLGE